MSVTRIESIKVRRFEDDDADLSWLTQGYEEIEDAAERERYRERDRQRLADYGHTWWMVGIDAVADVQIHGVLQRVRSGGIWGVETDSDPGYFHELGAEQVSELATILSQIGFAPEDIAAAIPVDTTPETYSHP